MSDCWNMTTNYALIATTLRNHPLYIQVPTKWKISDSIFFRIFPRSRNARAPDALDGWGSRECIFWGLGKNPRSKLNLIDEKY